MKSKVILGAALVGSALVATAAQALTNPIAAANRLYVSGATATDSALRTLFLRASGGSPVVPAICQAGTIDVYMDAAVPSPLGTDPLSNAKNVQITCSLNVALTGLAVGQPIAIFKESTGGSAEGTTIIADAASRSFLDGNCATAGTAVGANTPSPRQAYTLHGGCAVANVRADVGIADVNPALFSVGSQAITTGQIGRLTSDALYQPMFAVAVSQNLYRALQRAQGKALTDVAATVPSLPASTIRGLFADGVTTGWSSVLSGNTPINDASFTEGGSKTVADQVYVCRRGDESGTQASFAQYFLDERCAKVDQPFKLASDSACQQPGCTWATGTYIGQPVFAGKGSGDVRNCLDAHNDAGAGTGASPDHYAIGILGSESKYDGANSLGGSAHKADGTQQFRYIAVDGRVPSLENVASGKYDFVEENVLNRRNVTVGGVPPISGNQTTLADYIKNSFANLDVITSLIVAQAHGSTGGLAGGLSGTPSLPVDLVNNPVSVFTKSVSGQVNDCGPAIPVAPTVN